MVLFFEFRDDLSGEMVFDIVVVIFVLLLFAEEESEGVGGFVVRVEGVDKIFPPDSVILGVIAEMDDAGDFVPAFSDIVSSRMM